jgi:hypothetical protein
VVTSRPLSSRAEEREVEKEEEEEELEAGRGELVRDFVSTSLYSRSSGYFNTHECIYTPAEVDFTQIADKWRYDDKVKELYDAHPDGWLTPVELFQPYYGEALARWIHAQHAARVAKAGEEGGPHSHLQVVEVGGGNGTCAINILNFFRREHPDIYSTMRYTICEASERLSVLQMERAAQEGHADKFEVLLVCCLLSAACCLLSPECSLLSALCLSYSARLLLRPLNFSSESLLQGAHRSATQPDILHAMYTLM